MYNDYLCHYGVKGMKWGIRKEKPKVGKKVSKIKNFFKNFTILPDYTFDMNMNQIRLMNQQNQHNITQQVLRDHEMIHNHVLQTHLNTISLHNHLNTIHTSMGMM